MESSQKQALFITLLIILGLGYYVVPDSLLEKIEVKEWLPEIGKGNNDNPRESIRPKTKIRKSNHPNSQKIIDNLNGIDVFHNGSLGSVYGRHVTADGYNLGLKYQCVEFVKRFYYEQFNHKMPQSYGHAKEFFDRNIQDGGYNKARGLMQYSNESYFEPKQYSILVFSSDGNNPYGHVGIISKVKDGEIEMISQNNGHSQKSRSTIPLLLVNGKYKIDSDYILGWLSK